MKIDKIAVNITRLGNIFSNNWDIYKQMAKKIKRETFDGSRENE
jgi:hypothetical protein